MTPVTDMRISHPVNTLLLPSCLLALFLTPAAAAMDIDANDSPTEFNLYLSRHKTILDETRPDIDTTTEWLGFSFYSRINAQIEGGFFLGYSFSSQENAALTSGMNLNGAHLGLALRMPLVAQPGLRVGLQGRYVYQNVDDVIGAQAARLVWHTYDIGLSITKQLTPAFGIHGGILYGSADGTETASGPVTQTRSFGSEPQVEGIAGVVVASGPDGSIGIHARSGLRDGIELVFSRHY